MAIRTFGPNAVDWEQRVDLDRLREARLARLRATLERSSLGALLTFDFSRVPSIMEERASTYRRLFFQSLRLEGVFPEDNMLRVVVLRHIDVEWAPDLSDLPATCRAEQPALTTPAAVREHIAEIPTRLEGSRVLVQV